MVAVILTPAAERKRSSVTDEIPWSLVVAWVMIASRSSAVIRIWTTCSSLYRA